jgi:hypothetical protein
MSEESELAVLLSNAPRLKKAFGRRWAAFLTFVGLYFVRRRPGFLGLMTSFLVIVGLGIQAWLKVHQ